VRDLDTALHWTIRALAVATLLLFLYALFALNFPAFIGALETGIVAYILIRLDVERHPVKPAVEDLRADDEEEPPTEADGQAVYALQAAGIPLSFETRSRGARKGR
jgi:hypothetical protein